MHNLAVSGCPILFADPVPCSSCNVACSSSSFCCCSCCCSSKTRSCSCCRRCCGCCCGGGGCFCSSIFSWALWMCAIFRIVLTWLYIWIASNRHVEWAPFCICANVTLNLNYRLPPSWMSVILKFVLLIIFDMNMSYRLPFCETIAHLMSHNNRRQLPRRKWRQW